ncbi:unnamed protein product [Psylliodes chrysocephalus]|uniref:Uncharacterized protein n=1 Tax=Psylliodes chrysocephalus TaxID=3402493 RepID=A0A9P0DEP5_9CUCU|nr:unnamed protein product [Psylliodes chrysocephala]
MENAVASGSVVQTQCAQERKLKKTPKDSIIKLAKVKGDEHINHKGKLIEKRTVAKKLQIGRATVKESRSLRLVHDVHLNNRREDTTQQPLLVVGNGRTYSVTETSPKRAIMGVIQKAALIKKSKSNGSITTNDDCDEQIYWLRPALAPSQNSPDGSNYFCWFKKKPKQKVTFKETTTTVGNR